MDLSPTSCRCVRQSLAGWAWRQSSSQALALRCRIVLACAEGPTNSEVAADLRGAPDGVEVAASARAGPSRRARPLDVRSVSAVSARPSCTAPIHRLLAASRGSSASTIGRPLPLGALPFGRDSGFDWLVSDRAPRERPPVGGNPRPPETLLAAPGRNVSLSVGGHKVGNLVSGSSVRLPEATAHHVDIVFAFDTTGSMSDKIEGLTNCLVGLVRDLAATGLDWRIACVPFGDLTVPGDRIVESLPFVSQEEAAVQQIRALPRFSGGGNDGESASVAMMAALRKPFRSSAVKLVVLLTDEPSLDPQVTGGVNRALRSAEVLCFVASTDTAYYREWATSNGGMWYPISAHMNTSDLNRLLQGLLRRVARTAADVHELAAGSVRRYLELNPGE
jgi:hypothetical protein